MFSLLLVYTVFISTVPVLGVSYRDIFSEGLTALVILVWIGVIARIYEQKILFIPLFLGLSLFFLGSLEDFLDEFFVLNLTFIENLVPIGLAIASYGIIKWMYALIRKTTELEIKNKKLEEITKKYKVKSKKLVKIEKKIKIQNKKLEQALEDFYELRVSVEKDKKKIGKENKKIRKRIDKLKK
ncbi:MAG: hypothetical protein L3J07_04500 [Candidatus Magasanikbacteria bacterium]|nr:hypothetical protein [Candidatus Magasanikbacteria bacterium]